MRQTAIFHRLRVLWALLLPLIALPLQARIRLPHILSDGMVIQQLSDFAFWGLAKPNTQITVVPSWNPNKLVVDSDSKGRWRIIVRAPGGSFKPHSITFSDGQPITINNILAGEVWVCAGQSNMEMPVRGFNECPVEGYQEAVWASANMRGVRYVKIPARMSSVPLEDTPCQWVDMNPKTVSDCSAVGFFFAQRLAQVLQMPVGLVLANKGGTMVESWLNADNLHKHTDEPTDSTLIARKYSTEWLRPLLWGNGTFQPIVNYGVRGVLYYQGCANVDHNPTTYGERLKLLAQQWRKHFSANMPMLLVEIAPHRYEGEMGTSAAFIREQQYKASLEIPNCAMVSTNDLVYPYEVRQIHPSQKRPIGERLALTALARYYGYEGVMYKHPTFERMEIKGDTCVIHLKDTYTGIVPQANYEGFEMAGADRIFYPADATYVRHNKFRLTSKAVPKPVAVRYCYRNFLLGNVKNQAALPLIPFRTDNW
ncbi:sialate O-acetylesterase [Hoylesella loescheii]|uniref:Sialate O-acetylesterase domain-containing protein n=1 Tax=Hoylesella loescheii DSM 19665 = JCM 12249 = ATCC 15930 TaxID=1122985 RepID=A0A069QGZ4_HOYLO|nr:sialate O-acetylesterase [Hoylesella loescheii]KDR52118.1 hypothetical protein HMPREF1991_01817 [Hoylesella loescheii DSM 19665 = JCM 12249 = ATCC 15930]